MNPAPHTLAALQAWMQHRIMHPRDGSAAVTDRSERNWLPADVFTDSSRLSADERVAVYVNAYAARLIECLRLEYPAVRHAAGTEAFDGLAAGYLQANPSASHTLADLGRGFGDYLRSTRPPKGDAEMEPDFADFLIDLADLERTYSEVFDAPGPERIPGMSGEHLAGMGVDQFRRSRLEFFSTVRLLALNFPCHDYASRVRRDEDATPPDPCPTWLVVFRRNYVVRRMELTSSRFELLSRLMRGNSVENALAQVMAQPDCHDLSATDVQQAFAEWAAMELICAIRSAE